jgi:hypothetical protein
LTSCSTANFSALSCPPVKEYSKPDQLEAARELEACRQYIPGHYCQALFDMMKDYHVMRRQSRACVKAYH